MELKENVCAWFRICRYQSKLTNHLVAAMHLLTIHTAASHTLVFVFMSKYHGSNKDEDKEIMARIQAKISPDEPE